MTKFEWENDTLTATTRWEHKSSKRQSQHLWEEFIRLFKESLEIRTEEELAWAWASANNRTSMYRNKIMEEIADGLDLINAYELFRVDSTLCVGETREKPDTLVPVIHVESENSATTASHEVRKLCALKSKLKVLISCDQWSRENWKMGGSAKRLMPIWRDLVRNHHRFYPDDCEYGVIVAEFVEEEGKPRVGTLHFYATTLTEPLPANGKMHGEKIFKRRLDRDKAADPHYKVTPVQGDMFKDLVKEKK
ncbi:hypothetical protein [Caballeronia sp. SBC2]|uniref:hypothetical protein n=1 Tax=Caballeronia sp. SBC2 TaxID=2705547 RepID=UPI0013E204D5|nr:hypothetical protein [Caballeronia sp. SBC2]QIE22968.1 hypothetical protein SBC2_09810 [Caballeronia sp. SBC2]